jgi:hypothetical protein
MNAFDGSQLAAVLQSRSRIMVSMKTIAFALFGMGLGPTALGIGGFIFGGINRAAPCHEAQSFLSGGIFGSYLLISEFGAWAALIGAAIGLFAGFMTKTDREQRDRLD